MADNNVIKQGLSELQSSITELNKTANMSKPVKANIAYIMDAVVGMQAAISAMGSEYLSDTGKAQLDRNIVFMQNYVNDLKKLSREIGAYSDTGKFSAGRSGTRTKTLNATNTKALNSKYSPGTQVNSSQSILQNEANNAAKIKERESKAIDAVNASTTREMATLNQYYQVVEKVNKELLKFTDTQSRLRVIMSAKGLDSGAYNINSDNTISVNDANAQASIDAERVKRESAATYAQLSEEHKKERIKREELSYKSELKIKEQSIKINKDAEIKLLKIKQDSEDKWAIAKLNSTTKLTIEEKKLLDRVQARQEKERQRQSDKIDRETKQQSQAREKVLVQANEAELQNIKTKEKLLAIVKRINTEMIKVNPENRGALGSSIAAKSGGMLNFNETTGQIEAASEALEQLSASTGKAEKSVGFFAKAWSRITFVITAKFAYEIIGAIQQLVSSVPKMWRELEVSMSETFGILNQQGASVRKGLTDGVIDLSKKYGIAAKEISNALYEVISAQVKAADAIQVLDTAIKLSLAGKGNIKDSVEALVEIMNAYDMEAKDVGRIADIAFQTSKYGQLTIAQYTSNMSKIVATASLMKIPIEEVSAAIATMTLNGVHAEQAFTALNQMFMIIANPTDKAEKMMKQLGISIKVADVRTLGLAGALAKLQPLMAFENNEEAVTEIFKSRTGFKAFASLMQNNEEYVNNYINMINSSGVADAAFKEREFTLDVQTNRLKTTFEALTISIGKAFAPTQLKYVTSLSNFIENLNDNLWRVIASIKALGITLATVMAIFSVQKIIGMTVAIKALFTMTKVELAALKANLASATAGISLIVGLIASLVLHIVELGKHKANLKLEEKFGIKKAREGLQSVNIELAKLNTAMNRFSGVQTMIEQWTELNNVQNKNPQQIKTMDAYFKGIESTMNTLGITVDNTGSKLEQIARYSAAASKEILDFNNKLLTLESRKSVLSLRAGTGETFADASTSKDYQDYKKQQKKIKKPDTNRAGQPMPVDSKKIFGSKTVMDTMNKLRGDYQSISVSSDPAYLSKMYDKWNGEFDKLSKIQGVFTVETEQFRARALEQINDNIALIIMRQQALIQSPEAKPFKPNYGGINPAQSKSAMNPDDLIRQILGNPVEGMTVSETKANALKLIAEFKKEMSDRKANKQIITNEAEINKTLDELTASINDGTAEILPTRMKKSIEDRLVELDSKFALGENVFEDVKSLYLSTLKEQGNLNPSTYKGKADKAAMLTVISDKARSLLGNEEYIDFMKAINLLNPDILNSYNAVQSAYENSTDPNVKAALKTLLDAMDDDISKVISGASDTPETSKWLSAAKSSLKQAIDTNNKPMTPSEMDAYIASIKAKLLEQNRFMSKADEKALRDINNDAKGSTKSRALGLFGIEDFKTNEDATFNVAGKMVESMQNIWSGYWDWEIQSIESQQKKKLELMDKEKAMMLANQNLSSEQRAILEERYAEKRRIMEEKNARKISALKKRQAKYEAGIDLAKGLISIWATKLATNPILAAALAGALTAVFAAQMAIINNTKFAKGGFTGAGSNYRDETGQKPAGIVHANEMVFPAKATMANLPELMALYQHLNAGGDFSSFMMQKMNTGGYVSASSNRSNKPYISGSGDSKNTNITIDMKGIRTIDEVDLSKLTERGNLKRRHISG